MRNRNHLSSVLALKYFFELPVSLSDKMQLRHFFERAQEIDLKSKNTNFQNWVRNYQAPWLTAVVHYFMVNFPEVDYQRVENVLRVGYPSEALSRELKEIREQRGY